MSKNLYIGIIHSQDHDDYIVGVYDAEVYVVYELFNVLWKSFNFLVFDTDDIDPTEVRNGVTNQKRLDKCCRNFPGYLDEWSWSIKEIKLNHHEEFYT
jgi:hypothetical protein